MASCAAMLIRGALLTCLLITTVAAGCGGSDGGQSSAQRATAGGDTAAGTTAGGATATAAQGGTVSLQRIASVSNPTAMASPPGDTHRLFVTEQGGRIRVVRDDQVLDRAFLDISREVLSGGEQGLLGIAFAPDYATSGLFYVHYTNRSGDTRLVEYRRSSGSEDVADRGSARVVLRQKQPQPNHNGGQLAFGPDKLLYMPR
jgi:glucose/arabinose dehydrogenase